MPRRSIHWTTLRLDPSLVAAATHVPYISTSFQRFALHCTSRHCGTALYLTVPELRHPSLYRAALHCGVLRQTSLNSTAPHCTALLYTALHCAVPPYAATVPHCAAQPPPPRPPPRPQLIPSLPCSTRHRPQLHDHWALCRCAVLPYCMHPPQGRPRRRRASAAPTLRPRGERQGIRHEASRGGSVREAHRSLRQWGICRRPVQARHQGCPPEGKCHTYVRTYHFFFLCTLSAEWYL